MVDASYGCCGNEGPLGLIEVLSSCVHQPQMRLHVHIEALIPIILEYIIWSEPYETSAEKTGMIWGAY